MTTLESLRGLPPPPTAFPPLPPLVAPVFERFSLSNGLRVVLLEDREAPLVRGVLLARGGERASPPAAPGLASVAAAAQRAGGSAAHPGAALDDALEALAASVEAGAGEEAVTLGFQSLAEDLPAVLNLFAEVVTDPALPAAEFDRLIAQAADAAAHRDDRSASVPAREVAKMVYGARSPYAREATPASLRALTRGAAAAWIREFERPDAAVLGLVGDFDAAAARSLIESSALGAWAPPAGASPFALPRVPPPPPPGSAAAGAGRVLLVDRPGLTQAALAAGELGVAMGDPDEEALDVLGSLLNGFSGRLFNEIRSREGLAYSVSAGWPSAPAGHEGLFLAAAETARPAELLAALRAALQAAAAEPPTAEELARAKEEALNSFVFGFASKPAQLQRAAAYELLGISPDRPFRYRDRLQAVTPVQVQAAAARRLHPAAQVTVVVGDAKTVAPALEAALGVKVERLELQD
jgi:zinc protease